MNSAYMPMPGTIPYRVIQYLKTLHKGAEVSTPELCEQLQIDPDGSLGSFLQKALKGGALRSRYSKSPTSGRRVSMWSLGDDVPMPDLAEEDDPDDEPGGEPRPAPTAAQLLSAWGPPRSVFDLAAHGPANAPVSDPEDDPPASEASDWPPPAEEVDDTFVCAIWSDGRLQLQRGGAELALLTVEETRELVRYLERMACEA